ncbi:hypothetical protein D3C81_2026500 [compost metagenome]
MHPVGFLPFGSEHDHGRGLELAEPGAYLHPVDAGKHQVQKNQVVILLKSQLQGGFPVLGFFNAIAFLLQIHAKKPADSFFIVDYQYI